MTEKQLAEFIAILDKLQIEKNPNLTSVQKELMKQWIDELRKTL